MPEELEWNTRKERIDRKLQSLLPPWTVVKHRPPLNEQHEIVRRVKALFKIADDIETRYQKAKAHVDRLTQSILAKAFHGELVPQDPAAEPASELLARIREERRKQAAAQPRPEGFKARRKTRSSTL
jgi:type I restriction enzyme, S subunit